MSEELSFFESSQRKVSYRGNFSLDNKESPPEYDVLLKNITIFDLAKAFKKAIEGLKPQQFHEIQKTNITIDEMIEYILNRVNSEIEVHFMSLVENMREKIRIVITFVALLELAKAGSVLIKESSEYNDFVLVKGIDG
jgi:segregation and condensation protein A